MNRQGIKITFEMNCLNTLLRYVDNKTKQEISIVYESTIQAVLYFFQIQKKIDCIIRL